MTTSGNEFWCEDFLVRCEVDGQGFRYTVRDGGALMARGWVRVRIEDALDAIWPQIRYLRKTHPKVA